MRTSITAAVILILGNSMVAACHSAASAQPPQTGGARPPYRIGAMTIPSGSTSLAGTVTVPEGPGPFPAVIVAGATEMAATIADGLTRQNIVVLRAEARSADDILAMVTQVKNIPSVDPARIGVVGIGPGAQAFLARMTVPVYRVSGDTTTDTIIGPLATWVLSLK
jgi:dienelactone hydrolase